MPAFVWELGSNEAAIVRRTVVPAELLRGQGWITPLTAMFLHGRLTARLLQRHVSGAALAY